jgi:hypothetical protein
VKVGSTASRPVRIKTGTTVSDTRSVGSVSQLGIFESKGHTLDGGNLDLGNVRRQSRLGDGSHLYCCDALQIHAALHSCASK